MNEIIEYLMSEPSEHQVMLWLTAYAALSVVPYGVIALKLKHSFSSFMAAMCCFVLFVSCTYLDAYGDYLFQGAPTSSFLLFALMFMYFSYLQILQDVIRKKKREGEDK